MSALTKIVRFNTDFAGAEPPGIVLLTFTAGDERELHEELADVAIGLGVAEEIDALTPQADEASEPDQYESMRKPELREALKSATGSFPTNANRARLLELLRSL